MRVQPPPGPILRTVQAMLRLSGCARGRRGAYGSEAAGRAVTTRGWWRLGRAGFYFRLLARASGSRRKWKGVKIKRISPCAIAGQ
jgi:hypothetical protein